MVSPDAIRRFRANDEAPDWETLDECRQVVANLLCEFWPEELTDEGRLTDGDAYVLAGHLMEAIRA